MPTVEVIRRPRTTPALIRIHGPWQMVATRPPAEWTVRTISSARGSRSTGSARTGLGTSAYRTRPASLAAARLLTDRSRGVVVKARVVRHGIKRAPLNAHLTYLRREGVTKDGAPGRMFDAERDDADHWAFAERCEGDRHHFRFIVSPDDAVEMSDLKTFARDLVGQMEKDLGTKLEWVAVDHWNTEHPHVHLIVRGVREDGENLVISRDYIKEGMRDRARDLITRAYTGSRVKVKVRKRGGTIEIRSSIFCGVRQPVPGPLCHFYAAAAVRVLAEAGMAARAEIVSCQATGAGMCHVRVDMTPATEAA